MNTPRTTILVVVSASLAVLAASASAQTKILLDFGNSPTFGCVSSPTNWNSLSPGAFVANLADKNGVPTTVDFAPNGIGATDSYNSIAGATTWNATNTPTIPQAQIDAADAAINKPALGDLGTAEAAIDYFKSLSPDGGRFQLQQLVAGRDYKLTFYGTKQFVAPGNEQTRYSVYSDSGYSVLLGQATLTTGTTNAAGNPGDTASITVTAPANLNTILYVKWEGVNDAAEGVINSMSVEEVPFTPAPGTAVLIDFGNDLSFRGASQTGPDTNGNYWTSVWSGAFYTNLVSTSGAPTAWNFGITTPGATDSFNGPAGPTTNPITQTQIDNVQVNAGLLGPLGGSKPGVFDFYANSTFQLQNLDPSRTYQLAFFGSHQFNADDVTRYTVYTDSGFTNAVTSVDLNVGTGGNHNQSRVAVLNNISPQTNGVIYLGFTGASNGSGYLNALMLVEVAQTNLFLAWSGGQPATPALVGQYAFGGATGPNSNNSIPASAALNATNLTEAVIVRTNDPGLTVTGWATTNLTFGPWATNGVSFTADPDQTGVPADCQRRIYSVARGVDGKNFLQLQGVLVTP
jgi:hypothetical protein